MYLRSYLKKKNFLREDEHKTQLLPTYVHTLNRESILLCANMNALGGGVGSDIGDMGDSKRRAGREGISERMIVFWPKATIIITRLSYDHNLNEGRVKGTEGIDRIIRVK